MNDSLELIAKLKEASTKLEPISYREVKKGSVMYYVLYVGDRPAVK